MSSSDLTKQYYQVFSRTARNFDGKNETLTKDRGLFLLGKSSSTRKPLRRSHNARIMSRKKKVPEKNSAVFLCQGREDYYKSTGSKLNTANLTYSANILQRHKSVPNFNPKTHSEPKTPVRAEGDLKIVDKPSPKLKEPISFQKQLPRRYSYYNLNENRFLPFNNKPEVLSTVKRVSTPNFSKDKGHELQVKTCSNASIYSSNIDKVKRNPSKPTPNFTHYRSHKTLATEGASDLIYDVGYGLTEKASPSFNIKGLKRQNSDLPSYMAVTGGRFALDAITGMALKQNCFQSKDFSRTMSDFKSTIKSS